MYTTAIGIEYFLNEISLNKCVDEPMKYANNFLRACDRATVMLDCLGIYSLLIPEIFTFNFLMTVRILPYEELSTKSFFNQNV